MSPIRQGNNRVGYGGRKLPSFIYSGYFWWAVYWGGWLLLILLVFVTTPREWYGSATLGFWFFIHSGVFLFSRLLGERTAETCRKNYRR